MRITFVLPDGGLSGGMRVAAIYAERLKQRGHQISVVSTINKPSRRRRLARILQGEGWLKPVKRGLSYFDTIDVPYKVVKEGCKVTEADVPDADVVIATWWETAEWMAHWSPAKGAKAYFVQHHEVFDYLPVERVKATYLLPFHKIVISKWLVDLMRTEYGDADTSLVFNSVDTQQFYAPLRGKQSVPTVGIMYAQAAWKGCKVSFEAIAQVAQKIPNLRIIAFGSNEPVSELPLPANTTFTQLPDQHDIKDIYASCDVWLCGSLSEGFGLTVVEAMACRCPVVSSEVGGSIDLIKSGVNGYLAPIGDAQKLAEGLEKVLALSDLQWREMSDAAYQTVVQYSWDDATDLFEAALCKAIEHSHKEDSDRQDPKPTLGLPISVL
ncbi:MAG: glycosyltransferase family 4 protein [Timaviella obliquedivisa GSE-PSE-MK23-08B]|jgi:glycosyltransferase involved in cell wall biosynthesis|nr:glycosyltransferase family 4 protein [Timaviella obliquedivisa GSE-PSE-MK23-08B]